MLLVLAVVVGGIVFSIHKSKKVSEAWSAAAGELRLGYDTGGFMKDHRLSGNIDGRLVVVETFTHGSGKNSSKHTRYRVNHCRPLRLGMNLRKQGFFSEVVKAFGAQDIHLGDPSFDHRVMIKGTDATAVVQYLTPIRRKLICQALGEFDNMTVDDGGVQSEFSGEEDASQTLIRKVRRLVEFVRSLEDGHAASAPAELPAGTYAMTVHPPQRTHRPPPLPVPPPLPQQQSLRQEKLPDQKQGASTPAHLTRADRPAPALPAHEVGVALFGGTSGIAEAGRRFAADFVDREIEGQGVLRHAKTTDFDFVLGAGTFVKATVDVPLPAGDAYGRSSFQVILRLPAGTPCPAIGENMAIRGRLLKMDGLMRQLHVRSE